MNKIIPLKPKAIKYYNVIPFSDVKSVHVYLYNIIKCTFLYGPVILVIALLIKRFPFHKIDEYLSKN